MASKIKHSDFINIINVAAAVILLVVLPVIGIVSIISFINNGNNLSLWLGLGFIATLALIPVSFKNWRKTVRRYDENNSAIHDFNHRLRDELYALKLLKSSGRVSRDAVTANVEKTGEFAVNLLSKVLTEITGHEISVHIKTFPIHTQTPDSYRTLCICAKTDPNRKTIKDHPIKGNTHFKRIAEGHDPDEPHFFSNNLQKTIQEYEEATKEKFLISTANWAKWYQSIVVVPIRITARLKGIDDGTDYEYIGFLCCDAKETGAFEISDKNAHISLIKAFADGLYVYLDEIRVLLSNLDVREGPNKIK